METVTKIIVEGKKVQWGAIATFATVVVAVISLLGGLAITPVKEKLIEIEGQITQTRLEMASKDEVNKRLNEVNDRLNKLNLSIGKR